MTGTISSHVIEQSAATVAAVGHGKWIHWSPYTAAPAVPELSVCTSRHVAQGRGGMSGKLPFHCGRKLSHHWTSRRRAAASRTRWPGRATVSAASRMRRVNLRPGGMHFEACVRIPTVREEFPARRLAACDQCPQSAE